VQHTTIGLMLLPRYLLCSLAVLERYFQTKS